jgi:pyruvate/2-oxoglutarate dehydrogenase complex dihydrolipoamide dehydrogenase (E3) component
MKKYDMIVLGGGTVGMTVPYVHFSDGAREPT